MATGSGLLTAGELAQLPRGTSRYELVRGELRTMSPSGRVHGKVAARVGASLAAFVEQHALGETYAAETGFLLRRAPDTVRAPDAAFVCQARLARLPADAEGYFPGAPDLAVEVVSPSDSPAMLEEKVMEWLGAGTRVVLVLDPGRRSAAIRRANVPSVALGPTDHVTLPDLLPGWSLALQDALR